MGSYITTKLSIYFTYLWLIRSKKTKIKCINIYNDFQKKFQTESPWITIGKEYVVLEVLISTHGRIEYRIITDDDIGSPGIFSASQFEVTSDRIPSNWHMKIFDKSLIILAPKPWLEPGFWQACYDDDDPEVLEIYRRETRILLAEENTTYR